LRISTNISSTDWASFVNTHPNGTIFQSPEMFELFSQAEKFDPLVLGVHDEEELKGVLLGVFIHEKRWPGKLLSSRFVIYGGPLISGDAEQEDEILDLLLRELVNATKKKALFIQFRNFFSWEEHIKVFERNGFVFLDRLNFIVPVRGLRDTDRGSSVKSSANSSQLPGISESRRRQIQKGLSSGAKIIEPQNIRQVRDFYDILYKLYRYKVRKPLPDWSFFESFYNLSSPSPAPRTPHPGIGIIRLINYKDRIIGGILAPVFKDKCIYEWYVCGLDQEYKKQYPSVLATWAALEYAMQNNIESFDFMGVGRPDVAYGVRDFKARFGGEQLNFGRLTRINNRPLYNIAEFGYNILALLKKI
jgi:hypothetical protein